MDAFIPISLDLTKIMIPFLLTVGQMFQLECVENMNRRIRLFFKSKDIAFAVNNDDPHKPLDENSFSFCWDRTEARCYSNDFYRKSYPGFSVDYSQTDCYLFLPLERMDQE